MPTPPADVLVVFARAPRRGTVKTRLAAECGDERALAIHCSLTDGVIRAVRGAPVEIVVSFSPADAEMEMREWLGEQLRYEPQPAGDLGERMAAAIGARFADGAERVVVIGSDCPTISAATVSAALTALTEADVVFGPAADGGYYLVAVNRPHATLFTDIPWSSEHTLAVSLERAGDADLRIALLEQMRDVDTMDDWRWHERRRASQGTGEPPGERSGR